MKARTEFSSFTFTKLLFQNLAWGEGGNQIKTMPWGQGFRNFLNVFSIYRIYSSRRSSYKPSQAFLGSIFTKKILYSNNLINSVRLFVKVQALIIAPIYDQSSVFKNPNRIFLVFFLLRQVFLSFFLSLSSQPRILQSFEGIKNLILK